MPTPPEPSNPFTLEQLCRALAAHCLLSAHPNLLHEFLAPETAEQTAQFIMRFALGEPLERPKPKDDQDMPKLSTAFPKIIP